MAKKEVNPFNVSFLDLLSGALAAVIILFIIVPKLNRQQEETIRRLDSLNVNIEQLEQIIERARNSIPIDIYQQLQQQTRRLRQQIDSLRQAVNNLQQELVDCRNENQRLRDRVRQLQQELQQQQQRNRAVAAGGAYNKMFGVNAKFAVVCTWHKDLDVDLYLKNLDVSDQSHQWVFFGNTSENWAQYMSDIRSVREGQEIFEMIYQSDSIVQGNYEVWYHLYTNTEDTVTIEGYVVLFPFTPQEQKIKFHSKVISHGPKPPEGGGTKVASIKLTNNAMQVELY